MYKAIIADDEEFVRYFLKSILEYVSFEIIAEVEKGDELFSIMKENEPDLLLLDINMPNLTGMEFLKKYAKDFEKTCIIILTSSANNLEKEASETGAHCFLRKDTEVDKMLESIKETWEAFQRNLRV